MANSKVNENDCRLFEIGNKTFTNLMPEMAVFQFCAFCGGTVEVLIFAYLAKIVSRRTRWIHLKRVKSKLPRFHVQLARISVTQHLT